MVARKKDNAVTDPKNDQQTPATTADEKTVSPTPAPSTTPPAEHHDDTDVKAALQRKTQDGKGADEVPESDFHSFATDGVEKTETADAAGLAREVLEGRWGYNRRSALRNLRDKGHDANAVDDELQKLIDSGAPSTLVN